MKLKQQLLLGYLAVFAFIICIAAVTYFSITSLVETGNWVTHTHRVIGFGNLIQKLLLDMETGERGYLITGIDEFLEPYEDGADEFESIISNVKTLVSDNISQVDRLEEIDRLVHKWQRSAASVEIEARRGVNAGKTSMSTVSELIQQGKGKAAMDDLRRKLAEFVDVEKRLLLERGKGAKQAADKSLFVVLFGSILAIGVGLLSMFITTGSIVKRVGGDPADIANLTERVAQGNLELKPRRPDNAATGILASVEKMVAALKRNQIEVEQRDWLKTGIARLNEIIHGEHDVFTLSEKIVSEVAGYLHAPAAAVSVLELDSNEKPEFLTAGKFGLSGTNSTQRFKQGEGIAGQAAMEKRLILVGELPADYMKVISSLGETSPSQLAAIPLVHENTVNGVLEIGALRPFTALQLEYLSQAANIIAININEGQSRRKLAEALETAQNLSADLRKANMDLEAKSRDLAAASKYKSEFLANMSHELRTPLNSLLILSGSLLKNSENNLSAKQLSHIEIINNAGRELLDLINGILDLSKIEAGQAAARISDVSLLDVKQSLLRTFSHMAAQKGLLFSVEFEKKLPDLVRTDRQRLEQILKNLISNAIKFTERGAVEVKIAAVTAFREKRIKDCIAFTVKDTGIGIAESKTDQIFEAFQQADGGVNRKYGGTGLGLAIASQVATMLGGEIRLETREGEGSSFTLLLPLTPPAPAAADAETARQPQEDNKEKISKLSVDDINALHVVLKNKKTLAVDDDMRSLYAMEEGLAEFDVKVLKAADGLKALSLVESNPDLDIAVFDVMMPDMDGLEAIKRIRSAKNNADIPIIVVTAKAMEGDLEKCMKAGADGYLSKPLDMSELLLMMRSLLQGRGKNNA